MRALELQIQSKTKKALICGESNAAGRYWIAFLLLLSLIVLIYSNTFKASWHLDDHTNILGNSKIHLQDLYPDSLYSTFFASPSLKGNLYRPVSMLSLAVNWYFAKNEVALYHIVNVSIHILAAFFLFLVVLKLLRTPNLENRYQNKEYFIALLTAALWASHPIQTQAVTYIVQRMASLAAMFYLVGVYFYLKGRLSKSGKKQGFYYFCCLGAYLLATGSKENAVLLPAGLLLLEVLFFQNLKLPEIRKKIFFGAIITVFFLALAAGALLFLKGNLFSFLDGYEHRSFTLVERVLTEPRILVFYLSQIFYPIVNRLSISHDIIVSTSLLSPWTASFAILFIFLLVGIAISQIFKRPIITLAILFFFLNHLIEATIIPLELIFEHRNYLPSIFLFLPISIGLKLLIDHYRNKKPAMHYVFSGFIILLLVGLGTGTYIRNMTWATERTLWEDAIKKAPGRARPYQNLANGYYEKIGSQDIALKLYEKALSLADDNKWRPERVSYLNIGRIYGYDKKEYDKAIGYFQKLLQIEQYQQYALPRYDMVMAMIAAGRFDAASTNADLLLSLKSDNVRYFNAKGFILLKQKQPKKTLIYFKKALKIHVDNRRTLLNGAVALNSLGRYDSADHFLDRAKRLYPNDIVIMFAIIENNLEAGNTIMAKQNVEKMVARFTVNEIDSSLKKISTDNSMWPISRQLIAPVIEDVLKEKSEEIATLSSPAAESSDASKSMQ